jgi:hypothetical protein
MSRCAPVGAVVAELGPATGVSAEGVTGAAVATVVVMAACVHCIWVVVAVAGLVAALGAALGLERTSEEVARGESRVPARGFLPRLAAEETAARGLPLGVAEAPGLEGFAGMKVRS